MRVLCWTTMQPVCSSSVLSRRVLWGSNLRCWSIVTSGYVLDVMRKEVMGCMFARALRVRPSSGSASFQCSWNTCLSAASRSMLNLHDCAAQMCSAGGSILTLVELWQARSQAASLKPVCSVLEVSPCCLQAVHPGQACHLQGSLDPQAADLLKVIAHRPAKIDIAMHAAELCCAEPWAPA